MKAPGTMRLKLQHGKLLASLASDPNSRRYTKALGVDVVDPDLADGRIGGRSDDDGSGSYAAVLMYGGPSEAADDAIQAGVDAAVAASEAAVATADALHAARDGRRRRLLPIGGFMSGLTLYIARQTNDAKGALVKSIRAHGGEVVSLYDAARVTHVVMDSSGDPPRLPSGSTLATQVASAARDKKAVVTWQWAGIYIRPLLSSICAALFIETH